MKQHKTDNKLAYYLSWIIGGIIVLLPFHAFLTTWAGANFGHIDAFRIWKELLIVGLAGGACWLLWRDTVQAKKLFRDPLIWLIFAYAVLHLILVVIALNAGKLNSQAAMYGLLANLRYLGFFVIVYVVMQKTSWLHTKWPKLIFYPAAVVIGFGLLQKVLPVDFLTHFGYGPNTIPAIHTIDQKLDFMRIQSFLRGPNPLGAYLLLIITLAIAYVARRKPYKRQFGLLILGGLTATFFSYSRSAWIGLIASISFIGFWTIKSKKTRSTVAVLAVACFVLAGVILYAARDNNFVQNTLFHTDETSRSTASSNAARAQSLEEATVDVLKDPLGDGPGTAGPASFRNNQPPRIAENYYLQLLQEVGIIGFGLFVAISVIIAWRLYLRRASPLALGLLASLVGLTLVNLISHAWADDTLGLLFFGLAAIALTQPHTMVPKKPESSRSSR